MNTFKIPWIIGLLLFTSTGFSSLKLPSQLTASDRTKALSLLGPATSHRLLSTTYPLGGSQGFEISLSHHSVPLSYLSELGDKSGTQSALDFPMITLGKGLFYNFDLFLSFVPLNQKNSLHHFSTQLRYQIWQSENNLFRFSTLFHSGTSNLNNQVSMQSYGYDLVGTATIDRFSIFAGLGTSFNNGRFIGGAAGITDSSQTELNTATLAHQLVGLEWPVRDFFFAAEVDRYRVPYYSMKVGYRL
jgi:hypothetical protein